MLRSVSPALMCALGHNPSAVKASVFRGPHDIRVEDVPDPAIRDAGDAIVRVRRATVCGSDLWFYRGYWDWKPGYRTGHEFLGVVSEVGPAVETLQPGDPVLSPFTYSDGTCEFCSTGLPTSCIRGGTFGGARDDGGQGELVRVPLADGTLLRLPEEVANEPARLDGAALLADVVPTGHHAAVAAGVKPGSSAVVIVDGAVGLCAVIAARRRGAARIIAAGHHPDRLEIARTFGATDLFDLSHNGGGEHLRELTDGGAPHVLEAVGTQASMDLAMAAVRPGGRIGFVGVPSAVDGLRMDQMFAHNITVAGGMAPARTYQPELLRAFAAREFDPTPVITMRVPLDGVPDGYAAMDQRRAIKVLVDVT